LWKKNRNGSLSQKLGTAKVLFLLGHKDEAIKAATDLTGAKGYTDVKEAINIYHQLTAFFGDESAAKSFKSSAHKVFEFASEFMDENQLKARQEAVKPPPVVVENEAAKA